MIPKMLKAFSSFALMLVLSAAAFAQSPVITSVSRVWARGYQTILINGSGFGSIRPYTGNSRAIRIIDNTQGWSAGYAPTGDAVTLQITSWKDRQISITQLTGAYGTGIYSLLANDQVTVEVWNAQTLAGPAKASALVHANNTNQYQYLGSPDSNAPEGFTMDSSGNLYGFSGQAGTNSSCLFGSGCGTAVEMTKNSDGTWSESVLYNFQGGSDGWAPVGIPVRDAAGNLFGVTVNGGSSTSCFDGCGTVFMISGGAKTILHTFQGSDGATPLSGMVMDAAGNLYGTTPYGGSDGNVYELSPNGSGGYTYSVIYNFNGGVNNDGATPQAALVIDAAGNLYGTTYSGGSDTYCDTYQRGCGTVFELSPVAGGGWTEKVLHRFVGTLGGFHPANALIFDSAGNLYSVTQGGPATIHGRNNIGFAPGLFFGLSPRADGSWQEKTLLYFRGGLDVTYFFTDLTYQNGIFYGASNGGSSNQGAIYTLTPQGQGQWSESAIYSFGQTNSGPGSRVIFDATGILYGTAGGGTHNRGVLYSLP